MTMGVEALSRNPEAWQYIYENPDKILDCVNELMRYIAMSSGQPRLAAEDFEWHGKQIRKGQIVFLSIQGANRDPDAFANAEKLDFTRDNAGSLVFAPGIHHCIGHLLAKMQLCEFFSALVQRFEAAITPRTRVLHFSHVYFTTGQIAPIQRICRLARARGIEVVVDGGHAFAQFPFTRDDLDCDYFGTSLHKWLSAPVGTGFLYVRRAKIKSIWPLFAAPAEMDDNIRKFEAIGTFPVHIRNPITEALDFHEAIGPERKAARLRFLRRRWTRHVAQFPRVKLLTPDDDAQSCALGAMSVDGLTGPQLVEHLMTKHRIHVRARIVPNEFSCIRVTPNVYTTVAEIDAFARAIELLATKGL